MVTAGALMATLFLGGWDIPFTGWDNAAPFTVLKTILTLGCFLTKTGFFVFVFIWIRWTLPRFRYDQLMKLSWRALLPASLANVFATGVLYLAIDHASPYVKGGLHVAADVTQAVVAALITFALFRMLVGLFTPTKHVRQILGTSAEATAEQGGTKVTAMQA